MPIWRGEGDLDGVIRWRSSVAPFGMGHSQTADEQCRVDPDGGSGAADDSSAPICRIW